MIMLILRHAWLNLWDKHMTTGRINQVSKNQFSMLSHKKLRLSTNLHSRFLRHAKHERREFYFHHTSKQLQSQPAKRLLLIEITRRSNKRISTHYNLMRNSKFLKSTNTNSQTRRNSEEQQHSENCTLQLAPVAPKEETTETLNWSTFLMWRLIHLNSSAAKATDFIQLLLHEK